MKYTFCPNCGQELTPHPLGDEGLVPWCERCDRPWFDTFSTCIIVAVMNEKGQVLLQRETRRPTMEVLVAGFIKPGDTVDLGAFKVEFIHVSHSITGACALAISHSAGRRHPHRRLQGGLHSHRRPQD